MGLLLPALLLFAVLPIRGQIYFHCWWINLDGLGVGQEALADLSAGDPIPSFHHSQVQVSFFLLQKIYPIACQYISFNPAPHYGFVLHHANITESLASRVPDPWHFGMDPDADPRICTFDFRIRMRIRLRSRLFSRCQQKYFFCLKFLCLFLF